MGFRLRFSLLLFPLLAGLPPVVAGADQLGSLVGNSPFGLVGEVTGKAEAPKAPVEFRGLVTESSHMIFSVYETATRRSFWLGEDETEGSITVRRYDGASAMLTVDYGLSQWQLAMTQAGRNPVAGPAGAAAAPSLNPVSSENRDERRRKLAEEQSRKKAAELHLKDQISQQLELEAVTGR
jgi:hypothetical protein